MRLFGASGTTGIVNSSRGPIAVETWTHVAASCDQRAIQFFLNGKLFTVEPLTRLGALLQPNELHVGGDNPDSSVADVDDLRLFRHPDQRRQRPVRIALLGAIAGFTIFLGLPIGRLRNPRPGSGLLNALAIGILLFLLWDVLAHAWEPIDGALGERSARRAERRVPLAALVIVGARSACSAWSTSTGGWPGGPGPRPNPLRPRAAAAADSPRPPRRRAARPAWPS